MKRYFYFVGLLIVVALVVVTYWQPKERGNTPNAYDGHEHKSATARSLAGQQLPRTEKKRETSAQNQAPQTSEQASWESETTGDRTWFSMSYGDIGYIDVNSILRDNDPYSIVDLLQTHSELTGAGESLEIAIQSVTHNEDWGQKVFFRQHVNGKAIRESGSVFFRDDGTVTRIAGNLADTTSLNTHDVLILQPEAESIALSAAAAYAERLEPVAPDLAHVPVTLMASSAELQYDVGPDSMLTSYWRVAVGITGPVGTGVYVFISPQTGEVLKVESTVQMSSNGHSFIVCDGAMSTKDGLIDFDGMKDAARECDLNQRPGSPLLISVNGECTELASNLCQEAIYTSTQAAIDGVFRRVQGISPRSIQSPIQIIVRHSKMSGTGDWDETTGTIRISSGSTDIETTAVHEALHAASQSPAGEIEHGLVYGMTAAHRGGDYSDWQYEGTSVASETTVFISPEGARVANVIYRIHQNVGTDEAFKFGVLVDARMPATMADFERMAREVASEMRIGDTVAQILRDAGVTREENETEELNEAKEKYKKLLQKAMAQLTSAERAEIQGQYSDAQKKIQAATTVAIAQSNWEWIRDVIERIIEGREDDDTQVPVAPRSPPERPGNWPPGRPRPSGD